MSLSQAKLNILVDLIRYFNPRSLPETLHVRTVEHSDPAGKLSQLKFDESEVLAPEKRIPRVTNAIWSTESGGTVNFVHGIVLHGRFRGTVSTVRN